MVSLMWSEYAYQQYLWKKSVSQPNVASVIEKMKIYGAKCLWRTLIRFWRAGIAAAWEAWDGVSSFSFHFLDNVYTPSDLKDLVG